MTIESKPSADVAVDTALVRALLHEQHPDLAGLPLAETAAGWDNHLFRLGDDPLLGAVGQATIDAVLGDD